MDPPYSTSTPSAGTPNVSHPYPPSYRSQITSSPSTPPPPPAQSLHNPTYHQGYQPPQPPLYPSSDNPYHSSNLTGASAAYSQYDDSNGGRFHRTNSDESIHPSIPLNKEHVDWEAGDRPEGWTKEDEDAEREFLKKGMIDWVELRSWRFWIRKEWWFYYILFAILVVLVCLMSLYHDDIVNWLTPVANWMKALPGGWAIPIAIFFVISFPPLFGHEILAILVGAVWGLWVGFGITAAGTFIGEVGNFYAFKYCLRSRAEKYEKNNVNYACMAHVVREGGFFIIFVARLSAIPGHFTTAVFATCGMNIWIFMIACILTMPKQLIVVYLGVLFENKDKSSKDKIISRTVLAVGFLVTIWAAWYIWRKMHQARVHVWRKRRMEAASKGVTLDPLAQARRASYKEEFQSLENGTTDRLAVGHSHSVDVEDDSRSPILLSRRHQSYQNPYDIRYQSDNSMSVYDMHDAPPLQEQDISYGYRPSFTARFPKSQPTGTGQGVRREPSKAPTVYSHMEEVGPTAAFPVPSPAPPPPSFSANANGGNSGYV
ncbi:hypothetical protein IAR55_003118 [Kwoniella newhampshirensis]|uniref:Golgi apparatus membrane protein TVP38 n=1 Tax=Kwoniella newhampshirensis TaxID=1651941 RepID=A0AAW0Z0I6_9TREE